MFGNRAVYFYQKCVQIEGYFHVLIVKMMFTGGSHYKKRNTNHQEGRGRRQERHTRNAEREINKVSTRKLYV